MRAGPSSSEGTGYQNVNTGLIAPSAIDQQYRPANERWHFKPFFFLVGDHGYDNLLPSMHPFMAASGPSFRQGYKMRSLQSVDLYPLMCYLLQIPAQPNNGSLSNAKCLMVTAVSSEGFVVVSLVIGVIIFLMTTTSKCKHVSKDQCCVQLLSRLSSLI